MKRLLKSEEMMTTQQVFYQIIKTFQSIKN